MTTKEHVEAREAKIQRLKRLEEIRRTTAQKKQLRKSLRHLYGMKWYSWAWEFFNSKNHYNFLCAANQISKSSTQIRKCIHWATAPELWPELWPTAPTQFWYFYPDRKVSHAEYKEKWCKEWLPIGPEDEGTDPLTIQKKGAYHSHPIYGWRPTFSDGKIESITFNSGVTVYMKSYEQAASSLQTSSVYAMFCDEELPEHLLPELQARCFSASINGYFHMVFTATIGQEIWRETIEEKGRNEKFTTAWKRQVSMFDCLEYMDGSPSPWTESKIQEIIDNQKDENEVQRRVFGKFVVGKDRKYPGFQRSKNYVPGHPVPKNWLIYSGVDIGSGGTAHPAAIVFVAVKPDFSAGRVFRCWRGDGHLTESGDILDKWLELKGSMHLVISAYDHQAKDFFIVASRRGFAFTKADKGKEVGEGRLNTLFKKGMLKIYDDCPESHKLVTELQNLKNSTPKPRAKDDLIDALRFAVMAIPWDFSVINAPEAVKKPPEKFGSEREEYWEELKQQKGSGLDLIVSEMDEYTEMLDEFGMGGGDGYDGF